ncbi:hypothetical protein [Arthrobacter sp. GMC3]|uniref:hypothetical protein n=1 Tax=Arthrobacter sp. GMC3 TaxID=2058894 RepID=UPI0015E451B8|nr:hypothetical protein [Arthrobacter sp. GMC3]
MSQTLAPAAVGARTGRLAPPHLGAARVIEVVEPHGGLLCDDECQYCWGPETD